MLLHAPDILHGDLRGVGRGKAGEPGPQVVSQPSRGGVALLGVALQGLLEDGDEGRGDAACRLLEGPSKVGMDSLVGAHGVVAAWDGRAGTVIVQGSRWNAVAREGHAKGDEIEVVGFTGMTVQVARSVRHGDWEVT